MRIILDFDEVLYSLTQEAIEKCNKEYNTNYELEKLETYFVPEDLLRCMSEVLYEKGDKDNALIYVRQLCEEHDVYICSASMMENLYEKVEWIKKHLPQIGWDKTIVMKNKHLLNADVIVDDAPHNLQGNPIKYKIMIDMPYNKHVKDKDIHRVKNMKEAKELIDVWSKN